jgi:hypothetical protein
MSQKNTYDADSYTDSELYRILGFSGEEEPDDRELEVTILSNVNRYSLIHTDAGEQMMHFFTNIYRRFFELESPQPIEGLTNMGPGPSPSPIMAPGPSPSMALPAEEEEEEEKVFVNNSDKIFKDKLNPILTQTIKRTVVVDSQYRDKGSISSTSFTFNLSEPLKDIVSLKLYSVQIPYSWYTVNNSFGGNFFFIKGASPGIDDGKHDFRMNILSGNYSPDTLVTAINQSIQTLSTLPEYKDTDFGDTGISYNSPTCLSTVVVDLKKTFNESNFYMYFPEWTPPINPITRRTTLAGYMGFNYQTYGLSEIYSERDLILQNTSPTSTDNTNSVYVLDASNNAFKIHVYDGTTYPTANKTYISYDISLNSATYTRNGLSAALNTALTELDVFDTSGTYLSRIDISGTQLEDNQFSFFKLAIKLNRLKTLRDEGYKLAIEFPDETYKTALGQVPVWTGSTSCFHFMQLINECNQVLSETNTLQTNYVIPLGNQIQIKLVCSSPPYDTSFNTYNFAIPPSISTGYLLTDLVSNINTSIQQSNLTQSLSDTRNDLNYPFTQFLIDPYTNLLDLRIDLTRTFRNPLYKANIFHRYYGTINADLSGNTTTYQKDFPIASAYTLGPIDTFVIRPNMTKGFVDASGEESATFRIEVPSEVVYLNYQDLQRALNNLFISYVDPQGDRPLENTRVSMEVFGNTSIRATLKIVVAKTMTQLDYTAVFYDETATEDADNIWVNKLFFMPEYILADAPLTGAMTTITNTKIISDNQIIIDRGVNDTFYILPYPNISGINPATRDYDIKITIPNGTYSRNTLYNQLNVLFAANPLCPNTRVSPYLQNGKEYTLFSVSVNKTFSTKDYKLTFYDTVGFSTCISRGSTKSIQNVTWDTTVGWLLGFRNNPEYYLSDYIGITDTVPPTNLTPELNYYNSANTNACVLRGDTGVSVNLYNYFLIVLDDYSQNHLNDGLVTTTMPQTSVDIPSDITYACNPITGKPVMSLIPSGGKGMTALQVYSNQQKILSQMAVAKSYSAGPYAKDVFALIPMKLTGLSPGQVFVETSGTLQNQDRIYFGPVNITRMTIKLLSDRGDLVDLNNTNWSFSIIAEVLYKQ